ncbi:ABC transporter ATP-binding protein [Paenibacillus guangzhouensis]|uniref:ABC transporter ATP-binding protein n=1 Tax=Paenibacillus guangzhouensis TaxID=1473112 RepID=UPI0012674AFE|nr:ABC transporter ATP-binding protein [Paenibacillus guangzhouensis]
MTVLEVDIVEAGYEVHEPKIHAIQFQVKPGELVGLIGPNGAGKSTTMKSLMGLLKHCKGEIRFTGPQQSYGYIPEKPIMYDAMTLWEHLELAAAAYDLPVEVFEQRANELLRQFRLQDVKHQLPASFSKGMQQKMMLVIGFLTEPDVYIVDEPFVGLDPRATKDFLRMLDLERKRGAGVLMSTHVLDTAERICSSFVMVDQGRVVASGTLAEIQAQSGLPEGTLLDCFDALT